MSYRIGIEHYFRNTQNKTHIPNLDKTGQNFKRTFSRTSQNLDKALDKSSIQIYSFSYNSTKTYVVEK